MSKARSTADETAEASVMGNSGKVLKEGSGHSVSCGEWTGGRRREGTMHLNPIFFSRQATFKVRAKFIYLFITNINICKGK